MSSGSAIEWTEATWNPVSGCTRVSAGCDHCYAVQMTNRLEAMGQEKYAGLTVLNRAGDRHFSGKVRTHDDALAIPLRWRKPRRIFVNSMSDLFHRDVPFKFIDKCFAVMALCPQHTFQVLTKRPERMAEYLTRKVEEDEGWAESSGARYAISKILESWQEGGNETLNKMPVWREDIGLTLARHLNTDGPLAPWPLPNIWLGASVENQPAADERIPHLLKCPAAVRFLSVEPLLGPVDLTRLRGSDGDEVDVITDCLRGWRAGAWNGRKTNLSIQDARRDLGRISWVIVGCESRGNFIGRFCAPDEYAASARIIIDDCAVAGVPVFHKQMPVGKRVSGEPSEWPMWARVREWPRERKGSQ